MKLIHRTSRPRTVLTEYFADNRFSRVPQARGFSSSVESAIFNAYGRIGSEFWARAVIRSRDTRKILVILWRTPTGQVWKQLKDFHHA